MAVTSAMALPSLTWPKAFSSSVAHRSAPTVKEAGRSDPRASTKWRPPMVTLPVLVGLAWPWAVISPQILTMAVVFAVALPSSTWPKAFSSSVAHRFAPTSKEAGRLVPWANTKWRPPMVRLPTVVRVASAYAVTWPQILTVAEALALSDTMLVIVPPVFNVRRRQTSAPTSTLAGTDVPAAMTNATPPTVTAPAMFRTAFGATYALTVPQISTVVAPRAVCGLARPPGLASPNAMVARRMIRVRKRRG